MKKFRNLAFLTWILITPSILHTALFAQSVSKLRLERTSDLQNWQVVPVTPEMIDANGKIVLQSDSSQEFFRMSAQVYQFPVLESLSASNTAINDQQSTILSVNATGEELSYQWYKGQTGDTAEPIAGATSSSYETGALTEDAAYWVRVTNAAGIKDSGTLVVTINRAPSIMIQPASQTIPSGGNATMTVVASGTAPLIYQWYQGSLGTTTTPIGTNSASFTTSTLNVNASYWVRVSNVISSVDSELATVTLAPVGFALIPSGSFTMGRTSDDADGDAPPVTVNLSAFYMGKYEVTKEEWDDVRAWAVNNGYTDLATGAGKASNHPVQTLTWWDAIKWCNARSQKEGLTPCYTVSGSVMKTGTTAPIVDWSANGYRLPTEAEWEKAARGGESGKRFPWGADTISHNDANFNNFGSEPYKSGTTGYHPVYAIGSSPYTSPVGSFSANAYGLYDMAGNVWEWCWDWYNASTYVNNATDPRGKASGTNRVYRGGSYVDSALSCRAAYRGNYFSPSDPREHRGFRVARSSVL
jgi:formylglycine-generating enzyme required for sulfatase activity